MKKNEQYYCMYFIRYERYYKLFQDMGDLPCKPVHKLVDKGEETTKKPDHFFEVPKYFLGPRNNLFLGLIRYVWMKFYDSPCRENHSVRLLLDI